MGARTTCPARTAVTADSSVAIGTAVAAPAAGAASTTGPAFDADGAAAAVTAVASVTATGRANPVKAGGTCNRAAPSGATLAPSTRIATYHWFTGDGMVHGVALRDGRASWYRNRWVRSMPVCA
ncbi:carotenoid oxygenase family protein, partial [Mycobacterium ulcerans]|uniref:carotenoid oxygenase family protein n=1 Tax=Mycobacterium ulcerans TaxID=1809 RepID=UPI0021D7A8F5